LEDGLVYVIFSQSVDNPKGVSKSQSEKIKSQDFEDFKVDGYLHEMGLKCRWREIKSSVAPLVKTQDNQYDSHGTAFFISSDGYFVTTAHGLEDCRRGHDSKAEYTKQLSCADLPHGVKYQAFFNGKPHNFSIISHNTTVAMNHSGSASQHLASPDVVIGKMDLEPGEQTKPLKLSAPSGQLDLKSQAEWVPIYPAQKVFILGYPGRGIDVHTSSQRQGLKVISSYITHEDSQHRGYYIGSREDVGGQYLSNLRRYNQSDIDLGIRIVGGASGGPALDENCNVVGMTVAGNTDRENATLLSSEKILYMFFSRSSKGNEVTDIAVEPNSAVWYLKAGENKGSDLTVSSVK